jgi:hypothetical protein
MSAPTELTRREIALSVLKDLRAQALHNRDLTEADLALLIAEYDYYQERIDTWTEPRPEVLDLEDALTEMRDKLERVTAERDAHLVKLKEAADNYGLMLREFGRILNGQ